MVGMSLKRGALFMAISIAAGLLVAFVAARVWPQLIMRNAAPAAVIPAVPDPAPMAALPVRAPDRATVEPNPAAVSAEVGSPAGEPTAPERAIAGSFASAVKVSAPAVVNVYAQRTVTERLPGLSIEEMLGAPIRPRYRDRTQQSLGSGVIVDTAGHIVTNHHVIADADQISVQLADGRVSQARVVGRDRDTDLAILQISLPRLPVMALGRSDQLQVGDMVLAIGSPLGLSQTVTHGIVSATGRAQLGVATFENFIQTDAAINEGNSGGALVDARGLLIGINTAVLGKNLGAEGIGIAIPVDLVRGVMHEILQHGRVIRGWTGIAPEDVAAQTAAQLRLPHAGVVVDALYTNSPALQAGMAPGDMIETIDGRAVRNAQEALAQIANRKPGTSIKVTGMRGQQKLSWSMKVIEPPQQRQ
jgi:S1-C subfamily serine protease